mgnify:CR=1 FL=1
MTSWFLQFIVNESLALILLLVCVTQYLLARRQRLQSKFSERQLKNQVAELEAKIYAVSQGAIGVGNRLIKVEQELKKRAPAIQKVNRVVHQLNDFDRAAQLSQTGASVTEIMKKTGIGFAEAELVALMGNKELAATH